MPTIGEVYDPIMAARGSPAEFERLLREAGNRIREANPDRCPDAEDGYRAACRNLEYYVQYFGPEVEARVKELLGRTGTFMTLGGFRVGETQDEQAAAPRP